VFTNTIDCELVSLQDPAALLQLATSDLDSSFLHVLLQADRTAANAHAARMDFDRFIFIFDRFIILMIHKSLRQR